MNKLENELRRALRREEPSRDFAARVMTKVQVAEVAPARWPRRETRGGVIEILRAPRLRWAVATLAACLLLTVVAVHRRRVQRERGELARQQAMLALQIASSKLNFALKQVKKVEGDARIKPAGRTEKL